jgi:hypothetical protein
MTQLSLNFEGPYSFVENEISIFQCKYKESHGIYLWTFKTSFGYLIHYVGETTRFANRQREHLINILGLNYGIYDPVSAKNGKLVPVWNGLWRDKTNDHIQELLRKYSNLSIDVIQYIEQMDVFFAEIDIDTETRRHIEGSIGWNLRNTHEKYKVLYPDDNHVGTKSKKIGIQLVITSNENILGLDNELYI